MADVTNLKQQVADLASTLTQVEAAVTALKNQPPAVATQADLDALSAGLTPIQDRLTALATPSA